MLQQQSPIDFDQHLSRRRRPRARRPGDITDFSLRPRVVCLDDLPALDVRQLARSGALQAGQRVPLILTGANGHELAVDVCGCPPVLLVGIRTPGGNVVSRSLISVLTTPCHFGRTRFWWRCPGCSSRTALLYRQANRWCCRACTGLSYRSQLQARPRAALSLPPTSQAAATNLDGVLP